MYDPCERHLELKADLVRAISDALPITRRAEEVANSAENSYEAIARVLVALRHEFRAADGATPDLRGRSRGYRRIVRLAYAEAGANADEPIAKRLTMGVSYWVRKLLLEQYGEETLRELGVLSYGSFASVSSVAVGHHAVPEDPDQCLATIVNMLNQLATDPTFVPGADLVRSATRAVVLLRNKMAASGTDSAA